MPPRALAQTSTPSKNFGDWRWPTFNIADIAVSCGAIVLAVILWREDVAAERAAKAAAAGEGTDTALAPDRRGAS